MPLFNSTTSRTFHTNDSPARASEVVRGMTVRDGSGGSLPPGVSATRTGPGRFEASGPLGSRVSADISVRSDGRGGSYVTETSRASSFVPLAAAAANAIHSAATSASNAYWSARSRSRG